jgi:5-(carboxyamino)imidazole ribonucleotide synthase
MHSPIKLGILGGGQLGRMLLLAAANYPVETYVLELAVDCPASLLCQHFVAGDIRDYDTVYRFGQGLDVITIEIEHVNTAALHALEREGVKVIPSPTVLDTIRDKGLQKAFYDQHDIATSPYILTEKATDLINHLDMLPAAHKLRTGGYDGKGVQIIQNASEAHLAFDKPCVLEQLVAIDKEIAVLVAISQTGDMAVYPPVEMVFDPKYNLVDMLLSPARLTNSQSKLATDMAVNVAQALGSAGLYAVELFLDKTGNLLVNETAPRAHNSGHQTIEGNYCSQYDMQVRILLGLPLGDTAIIAPSLMLNLIGADGQVGVAKYVGIDQALAISGLYVHLYGKTLTAPGRKMGHITIVGKKETDLLAMGRSVKDLIQVLAD